MANRTFRDHAEEIAAQTNAVLVVIANDDGEFLATAGDLSHSEFSGLVSALAHGPMELRQTYRCLDGMLLPQSFAQGDSHIFLHKPREGLLVLTGMLLEKKMSPPEKSAMDVYKLGRELDSVVVQCLSRP